MENLLLNSSPSIALIDNRKNGEMNRLQKKITLH